MQKLLRIIIVNLCLCIMVGFANVNSKVENNYERSERRTSDNQPTPYSPSLTRSGILFVEDPGDTAFGPASKPDPLWSNTLNDLLGPGNYGWFGPTTDPSSNGPDLPTMQSFDLVIWNCYDFWWPDMALTDTDQTNLQAYISSGGKVWLLGQDVIYSGVPLTWLASNFHLSSAVQDYCSDAPSLDLLGLAEINGITFVANCDYQSNGFWCDALTPDIQAHNIIQDLTYTQYNSIAYPNTTPLHTSFWTVDGRNPSNSSEWLNMVYGMLEAFGVYGVEEIPGKIPARKLNLQITPSVTNNTAEITYNLPVSENITIRICDKSGKLIRTLFEGHKSSGIYKIRWDTKDNNTNYVPNGTYFVIISCRSYNCSRQVTVIR